MIDTAEIREKAGSENYEKAVRLMSGGMLREMQRSRSEVIYLCTDEGKRYRVCLNEEGVSCTCGCAGVCAHMAAGVICAQESGVLDDMEQYRAFMNAPRFFEAAGDVLPEKEDVNMELTFVLQDGKLKAGLRMGREKLYVVRSLPLFLEAREDGERFVFGKGFVYEPDSMYFDAEQTVILDILSDLCSSSQGARTGSDARLVNVGRRGAQRLFSALDDTSFRLMTEDKTYTLTGIEEDDFPLEFFLSGTEQQLNISAHIPHSALALTDDMSYVFARNKVWHVEEKRRRLLRSLLPLCTGGNVSASFQAQDVGRVMNDLVPFLMCAGTFSIDPELSRLLIQVPLKAKVYLDKDDRDVTASVSFEYGEKKIDPFIPASEQKAELLLRSAAGEKEVLDELARSGFRVRRGGAHLRGSDRIYAFITAGAAALSEKCEVYFSKDFARMRPRKPNLNGSITYVGGRLHLDMMDGETPIEELSALMDALRRRRSYFRFREGTYLDLSGSGEWAEFAAAVAETEDAGGEISAPAPYRAAFLAALIRKNGLPVMMDERTSAMADLKTEEAVLPLDCLRPYQQRGFAWICALHDLGMGGILADEMGLGKTVQTIAAILRSCRLAEEGKEEPLPSLIVSPTSLLYNWASEIRRFAPDMTVEVIEGSRTARIAQILSVKENIPDIVITSYPLIRRDISVMRELCFRYIILDEAQNIKNLRSVGARSVKQLNGRTRLALTGTPMENHPGELWSLFDFVLPGYLPDYPEFLRRWGEGQNAEELLMRTRPFLMRRLKKDVLTELPPCTEIVLTAHMPPEQRRVYDAALLQSRERVKRVLSGKGGRGQAEILSVLMQLRQIACHPALCLPDYKGPSGKTDMLCDVLASVLSEGKRVLIFSQFTSMLKLIGERLDEDRIEWLYLDGSTPAEERVRLSDYFNNGGGQVFLVSLKAGGTGLNLTGADTVILYDPWWNPAAEDQATGRAHRIGQTRNVEVMRLVMHRSIEEDVLRLSEGKKRVFESLVTPGEDMPTQLTGKDLLALLGEDMVSADGGEKV